MQSVEMWQRRGVSSWDETVLTLALSGTLQARAGEFTSSLKGSVVRLLLDAGFLFLLRFSLDDAVENVMAASVGALRALLVSLDDEVR